MTPEYLTGLKISSHDKETLLEITEFQTQNIECMLITLTSGAIAYIGYKACTETANWISRKVDESKKKK